MISLSELNLDDTQVELIYRVATGRLIIWITPKSTVLFFYIFIQHLCKGKAAHFVAGKGVGGGSLEAEINFLTCSDPLSSAPCLSVPLSKEALGQD